MLRALYNNCCWYYIMDVTFFFNIFFIQFIILFKIVPLQIVLETKIVIIYGIQKALIFRRGTKYKHEQTEVATEYKDDS